MVTIIGKTLPHTAEKEKYPLPKSAKNALNIRLFGKKNKSLGFLKVPKVEKSAAVKSHKPK